MVAPPAAVRRHGSAACDARTIAITSTARPAAQPASSSPMPKPEALLTSTSMPPSAAPRPARSGDARRHRPGRRRMAWTRRPRRRFGCAFLERRGAASADRDVGAGAANPARWHGRCRGCRRDEDALAGEIERHRHLPQGQASATIAARPTPAASICRAKAWTPRRTGSSPARGNARGRRREVHLSSRCCWRWSGPGSPGCSFATTIPSRRSPNPSAARNRRTRSRVNDPTKSPAAERRLQRAAPDYQRNVAPISGPLKLTS